MKTGAAGVQGAGATEVLMQGSGGALTNRTLVPEVPWGGVIIEVRLRPLRVRLGSWPRELAILLSQVGLLSPA